jgi:hypothetical protein
LDQDVPAPLLRPISLAADLEGIGWCYTHLFRLGTGTRYQMVSTSRASTFSRRYQQWYYEAIRSYQSYTPPVIVRSTCPQDGQPLLDGTVSRDRSPFPDIAVEPVDFQGLDSRFSRAPVRTILTGTLHRSFRLFPFDKPRPILINSLFDSGLAYEYDHAEPGFSVPRPRVIGVHSQPPTEPPASAAVGRDRDGTSRSPSPFSFPSPIPGDFLY